MSNEIRETTAPLVHRFLENGPEGNRGEAQAEPEAGVKTKQRPEKQILCGTCYHGITSPRARTEIAGSHRHVFKNPHEMEFEIGCFARAPGCMGVGIPTTEFTWFPGYGWRLALCAKCGTHLGWEYRARADHVFFGLILSALIAPN